MYRTASDRGLSFKVRPCDGSCKKVDCLYMKDGRIFKDEVYYFGICGCLYETHMCTGKEHKIYSRRVGMGACSSLTSEPCDKSCAEEIDLTEEEMKLVR